MSRISELENQIRNLINEPRRRAAIRQKDQDWKKLCRSLDALGDTEMAFEAYKQICDSSPPGSSYILVYGFLQALSIQQDAVRDLYCALCVSYRRDPGLDEIRDVRNAVTHQTDGRNKKNEFRLIARVTLSKWGFRLFKAAPDQSQQDGQDVSLEELMDKQRALHEHALEALIETLCKQEMEYRKRFRHKPLAPVLQADLDSWFEQLSEALGNESWEFGTRRLNFIREVVERFQTALAERQLAGVYDNIEHLIAQITCPLEQLVQLFEMQAREQLNSRDAEFHVAFVQSKVAELRKAAREIDAEIACPPEDCSH